MYLKRSQENYLYEVQVFNGFAQVNTAGQEMHTQATVTWTGSRVLVAVMVIAVEDTDEARLSIQVSGDAL